MPCRSRRSRPRHAPADRAIARAIDAKLQHMRLEDAARESGVHMALLSRLRTGTYPYLLSMLNVRNLARWLEWSVLVTLRACDEGIAPAQLLRCATQGGRKR